MPGEFGMPLPSPHFFCYEFDDSRVKCELYGVSAGDMTWCLLEQGENCHKKICFIQMGCDSADLTFCGS
jgi:hypothetical protein